MKTTFIGRLVFLLLLLFVIAYSISLLWIIVWLLTGKTGYNFLINKIPIP